MAFAEASSHDAPVDGINIIPLCDVLLVLIVVFMLATPAATRAIPMDLPQPGREVPPVALEPIRLGLAADGALTWNGDLVPASALESMLAGEVARDPAQPLRLQVEASGDSDYAAVARVMAAAWNAGVENVALRSP